MITKNFKSLAASMLQASSVYKANRQVKNVYGKAYWLIEKYSSYPYSITESFDMTGYAAGISIGSGTADEVEGAYCLDSPITSGYNATISSKTIGSDASDRQHVNYQVTVTNTGSSDLTITEIGFKQTIQAGASPGSTSPTGIVVLIDRTVLSAPFVIPAGQAGVIQYKLQTIFNPTPKYVSGVKMVDWATGSDSDVAAVLDAARLGSIDLEEDAEWSIGDTRIVSLDAFTGGNSKNCPAQDVGLVLTSFDDYNSCGAVVQFDFVAALSTTFRMNASNTNYGGYGSSEMFTTTLPAMADALPQWLKSRLKTFDVLASEGNQSSNIVTVSGNKLALRAENEIFGARSYSAAGEGDWVKYYKTADIRTKFQGLSGSATFWWLRSPRVSNGSIFCSVTNYGTADYNTASTAYGVAPFGCI